MNPKNDITALFKELNLPFYTASACCEPLVTMASDTYDKRMKDLHEKLYQNFYDKESTLSEEFRIIKAEALQLIKGLREGWGERAVEAAWNAPDIQMLAAMELNIWNFASSKTEARLAAMSELMIDKTKNGIRSYTDFRALASKHIDQFNDAWLKTEYQTAIAVGQGSASFNRSWDDREEFPFWKYQTAGDSNVRDSHARLNGMVFNINDPAARRLWTPNGYKCRCENIQLPTRPHLSSVSKGSDALKILGSGFTNSDWNVNRAEAKEVFTQKQRYTRITALKDKLQKSGYTTYGLPKIEEIAKGRNPLKLDSTITKSNIKELFKKDGTTKGGANYMGFSDYMGRRMILKESIFKKHTTGKRYLEENRHQQFGKLNEVLTRPDEVWIKPYEGEFDAVYLKFYGDKTLVVNTSLQNEYINIGTWFELDKNEKSIRKGMEIKREKY